jgi:hypothetical protein
MEFSLCPCRGHHFFHLPVPKRLQRTRGNFVKAVRWSAVLNQLRKYKWLMHYLASKKLALALLFFLCIALIPGTFSEQQQTVSLGRLPRIFFAGVGINLLLCTLLRVKTLSRPVLAIHTGVLIIIIGTVMSAYGVIATINMYEGSSTNKAFLWNLQKDIPLGYDLTVKKINREYYPSGVQVGVLRENEKVGLFELKTGKYFQVGSLSIRADSLDESSERLLLSVFEGNRLIGIADTEGFRDLPPDCPYDFKLVAYQKPVLKRIWLDLMLSENGRTIAEGLSEVNGPFEWNGWRFYSTSIEEDQYGLPVVGIQIVRDPGTSIVFAGFAVISAGILFWIYKKAIPPFGKR